MKNRFLVKIGSLGLAKVPKVDFFNFMNFYGFFITLAIEKMIKDQVSTAAPL